MFLAHAEGRSPISITLWFCYPITPLLLELATDILNFLLGDPDTNLWTFLVVDSIGSSIDPKTDPNITLLKAISTRPFMVWHNNSAMTFSWSNRNAWI